MTRKPVLALVALAAALAVSLMFYLALTSELQSLTAVSVNGKANHHPRPR
jgi:hypothetical protein